MGNRKGGLDENKELFQPEPVENAERADKMGSHKNNMVEKNELLNSELVEEKLIIKYLFNRNLHNKCPISNGEIVTKRMTSQMSQMSKIQGQTRLNFYPFHYRISYTYLKESIQKS